MYYQRQIELWGEEVQESLKAKRVAIIGSGGLGCSIGISLSGSGIGQIDLIDFDQVEEHNIHRQIAFSMDDCGKYKSQVLKQMMQRRNADISVNAHTSTFEDFTQKAPALDLVIDATDNLKTRAQIDHFCYNHTPWIYGSVEEFHGQVCFFDKARFEDALKVSDKKPAGIAAPIVMQIASFEANLALRYLAGFKVAKDILNYIFYDPIGQMQLQSFKLPIRGES